MAAVLQMEANVHLWVLAAGRSTLVFFCRWNLPSRFSFSLNETSAFAGQRSHAADD